LEENSGITLLGVNIVYMITAILLVTIGYTLQMTDIYTGLVLTELVIILGPAFLFVLFRKASLREVFRIKKTSLKIVGLCALITFFAYPVGLFLNLVGNLVLSLFGELIPMPVPVAENFSELAVNLLIIALTAGVAEELFFRGLVLKGYEAFGEKRAVLITALLFGIFHFNIQNLIGPVFLGIIFGYMATKTGSIFPAITGHFINNALSVIIAYGAQLYAGETGQAAEEGLNTAVILSGTLFWGIIAVLSATVMVRLFRRLSEQSGISVPDREERANGMTIKEMVPLAVTMLIFAVMVIRELYVIIYGL